MARRSGDRYRRRLAQEQHAAAVYRALAAKRTGEDREILLALARAEERHAPTGRPSCTHPSGRRADQGAAAGCWAGWPAGSGPWSCSA